MGDHWLKTHITITWHSKADFRDHLDILLIVYASRIPPRPLGARRFGDPGAWRIAGLVVQRLRATKLSGYEARSNFELVKTS